MNLQLKIYIYFLYLQFIIVLFIYNNCSNYGQLEEAMLVSLLNLNERIPCKICHFSRRSKWMQKYLNFLGKTKWERNGKTEKKLMWRTLERSYNCLIRQWPINHPLLWLWQTFSTTTQWKTRNKRGLSQQWAPWRSSARGPDVLSCSGNGDDMQV